GPLVGTYAGRQYCVGLNRMGGTGRAESVFIAAAACAQFVERHSPGSCRYVDFGPAALADFLRRERGRLWRQWQESGPLRAFIVSDDGWRLSETPITVLDGLN